MSVWQCCVATLENGRKREGLNRKEQRKGVLSTCGTSHSIRIPRMMPHKWGPKRQVGSGSSHYTALPPRHRTPSAGETAATAIAPTNHYTRLPRQDGAHRLRGCNQIQQRLRLVCAISAYKRWLASCLQRQPVLLTTLSMGCHPSGSPGS